MVKKPESDPKQYQRFLDKVKELEDAGELNPTDLTDEKVERVLSSSRPKDQPTQSD